MPGPLAGTLCGALVGLGFGILGMRMLRDLAQAPPGWLRAALDQGSILRLGLPIALLAHAIWTAIGLFLGIAYDIVTDTAGLGGWTRFAVGIVGAAALATALVVLFGGRTRRWMAPVPAFAAVVLGGGLPLLAG